jgi:hypothetical protein
VTPGPWSLASAAKAADVAVRLDFIVNISGETAR